MIRFIMSLLRKFFLLNLDDSPKPHRVESDTSFMQRELKYWYGFMYELISKDRTGSHFDNLSYKDHTYKEGTIQVKGDPTEWQYRIVEGHDIALIDVDAYVCLFMSERYMRQAAATGNMYNNEFVVAVGSCANNMRCLVGGEMRKYEDYYE